MKLKKYLTTLAAGCMLSLDAVSGGLVIVNQSVSTDPLDQNTVQRLFLGKLTKLPNGAQANTVDQHEGNPVRDEFYQQVVRKSPAQLKAYWSKKIFSGKGTPPPQLPNDQAVKAWVMENPDALGYISEAAGEDGVNVVYRFP